MWCENQDHCSALVEYRPCCPGRRLRALPEHLIPLPLFPAQEFMGHRCRDSCDSSPGVPRGELEPGRMARGLAVSHSSCMKGGAGLLLWDLDSA